MLAAVVARFQVPHINKDLKDLLNSIFDQYDETIILLGTSPLPGSKNNPFSFESRKAMISKEFPDVKILPLNDHPNDQTWSKNLDNIIKINTSDSEVIILGSKDYFIPFYSGGYETKALSKHVEQQGDKLKEEAEAIEAQSEDFRSGMTYALHKKYDTVNPTVDIAVFRNDKKEILLGKKSINNKWRFIGGFVDPTDQSFEEAALRELKEEAGNIEVAEMKYICSQKVNDWRYRFERDKIITTLYQCNYISGNPTSRDDISDLQWFKVSDIPELIAKDEVTPEHGTLFKLLLDAIK